MKDIKEQSASAVRPNILKIHYKIQDTFKVLLNIFTGNKVIFGLVMKQ